MIAVFENWEKSDEALAVFVFFIVCTNGFIVNKLNELFLFSMYMVLCIFQCKSETAK